MRVIEELLRPVTIPPMALVEQRFDDTHIPVEEIPGVLREGLSRECIAGTIKPGMQVAITVGSRGVANVALITKTLVDFVKERGAVPFIVPAMGSHAGATGQGQKAFIASYGVTEESMGCEIRSSMETVVLGLSENGKPVHCDANAAGADGIIVCGRVKAHTAFQGPYESGICKMMCVGLGKQRGAATMHMDGFGQMKDEVPMFARVFLEKAPILFGVGLIENAYDRTREICVLHRDEIMDGEPELLLRSKSYMPRILFDPLDVLIVDELGKNISGDGMDPNITGRFPTPYAQGGITANRLAVLGISKESHGSAFGCGLADVTTRRLFDQMDFEGTYINSVTNTVTGVIKIPMVLDNDRMAIQMAIQSANYRDRKAPRIVRIVNTMELHRILISEALLPEALAHPQVRVVREPEEMAFDAAGNLKDYGKLA